MDANDHLYPELLLRTKRSEKLGDLCEWVHLLFGLLCAVEAKFRVCAYRHALRFRLYVFKAHNFVWVVRGINQAAVVLHLDDFHPRVLRVECTLNRASHNLARPDVEMHATA